MPQVSDEIMTDIINSIEENHKKMAGDLHEGFSQTLYSMYNGIQYIERQLNEQEQISKYIYDMKLMVERTIEDLRCFTTDLHPPSLELNGVYAALRAYSQIYTKSFGIEIEMKTVGKEVRLNSTIETLLFRICQDTLKLTAHYSDVEKVDVSFNWNDFHLHVEIKIFGVNMISSNADYFKKENKKIGAKTILMGGENKVDFPSINSTIFSFMIPFERGENNDKSFISR